MSSQIKIETIPDRFFNLSQQIRNSPNYFRLQAQTTEERTKVKWYTVALLVTGIAVILLGSVFGVVSLLHAHQIITIPASLFTQVINFIGNTSHFWSLYAIMIGSVVMGGILTATMSHNIAHLKKERGKKMDTLYREQAEYRKTYTDFNECFVIDLGRQRMKAVEGTTWALKVETKEMPPLNYVEGTCGKEGYRIAIRDSHGRYGVTEILTKEQSDKLIQFLTFKQYTPATKSALIF